MSLCGVMSEDNVIRLAEVAKKQTLIFDFA